VRDRYSLARIKAEPACLSQYYPCCQYTPFTKGVKNKMGSVMQVTEKDGAVFYGKKKRKKEK